MTHFGRIRMARNLGHAVNAFAGIEQLLDGTELSVGLRHLVKLRASQINGCAFCVGMHTREARKDGETGERLDHVIVWRDTDLFSAAERAALAWTEAVTEVSRAHDLDTLHGNLKQHFSDAKIAALTTQIAMINVWNRLRVAAHGRRRERGEAMAA